MPVGILAEIAYLVETRLGNKVFDAFLRDIEARHFSLDCGLESVGDVRRLAERYADLPLGYADATVITCALKYGGRVVSLDRRDFEVVQRELDFTLLP